MSLQSKSLSTVHASRWLNELDTQSITCETTDEELREMQMYIEEEAKILNGILAIHGLREALEKKRSEKIEACD